MSRASPKAFLSRLRERGGGEGQRIREANRIHSCALTSPRNSAMNQRKNGRCAIAYRPCSLVRW
ncbi:hypothetical protein CBM2634_A160103 [Cupriavidus taiwanensis]|uniref:Uncharacterized protein n=1 Tax=Cupriavidus taiwanensis TaxID=164546 RepID=A0A375IVW9_9BURK|nr:hypothetical protein CBM2634_A160103 [Cupriavidus taiwanensis]